MGGDGWQCAPGEDIGAEHAAHYVAEMRDIVDIWQGACNEDVFLSFLWKNLLCGGHCVLGGSTGVICGILLAVAWNWRGGF